MAQVEISDPLPVLDSLGRPANFGWARKPLFSYDASKIWGPVRRITETDRYIIFSSTHMLLLEVTDGGLLGSIGVSVISLKDKQRFTQSFVIPFPMGSLNMPPASDSGSVKVQQKGILVEFAAMQSGARIIKVDIPQFGHNRYLRGALVLSAPDNAQSLVTHMAWRGEKYAFRLARRSPWYIAEGVMQFGGAELIFTKGSSWGIFDWIRGCRPDSDIRFWASACGLTTGGTTTGRQTGESQIGFCVGYGSADSSWGTENAFFVDGVLHKLDQVTFHISPSSWMQPWRFTSSDNRLEMTFSPHQERVERNRMFLHSVKRNQVCGSFSGTVILDDGSPLCFENLTGAAERRKSRF
jgi:hypothetical protein